MLCNRWISYRLNTLSYLKQYITANRIGKFASLQSFFGRTHIRDDVFLPDSVLLRDVLDEGFPPLELDLADAALQTPPLRVHLHVVLQLVLVAQHFVAYLGGRKIRVNSVNFNLFLATYGAFKSVLRLAAVHELLVAEKGLLGAVLLPTVTLVPLDAAVCVLVLLPVLGVEESLVAEAARVVFGLLSLGVLLGSHILAAAALPVVVAAKVNVEILA